jgi:hypothetical protein
MPSPGLLTVIVVAAVVGVAFFLKSRRRDRINGMIEKRRATSQLVTRADLVEAVGRVPVVLALSGDTLYYENPDVEADFDLTRIDEVEYDNELATGRSVRDGCSVLRLRSHGATFEFVLHPGDCEKWKAVLKPRFMDDVPAAQAM